MLIPGLDFQQLPLLKLPISLNSDYFCDVNDFEIKFEFSRLMPESTVSSTRHQIYHCVDINQRIFIVQIACYNMLQYNILSSTKRARIIIL